MIAPDLLPLARPIASLREDPHNARKHDKRNLAAIAASLSEFGQRKPIVALADGTVIAGNGTLAAAKSLGWTEIAVATFEDEEKAKAYAIADNRAGELASWDDDLLAQALSGIDESLRAACGFSSAELERLCKAANGGGGDPDAVPEPPAEPTAKRGDLFLLGKHRLLCGDSTNADDVRRVLDGATPRLLLTDPPYGVSLDMEWRDRAGLNGLGPAETSYLQRGAGHKNTAISGDTKADWSDAFELVPSLDTAYVWHASSFSVEVGAGLRRIGFELKQQIIWRKPHFVLSRQHYHWQHEPCWYARKEGSAKFRGSRDQSTIWDAASPKMLMNPVGEREEKVDHPTQKPVALYTRPIENHLEPGECFYEPFGGSGSAIAAAETTGRRCFAIELDPKYVDVIVARWERLSGKKAERCAV
ncbi:MAG: site-specific DNA-methyltransferase [Planctomycetes bacterium]|nr:site-specific DNA-methyltransferase [Planctomycetota bacterium]